MHAKECLYSQGVNKGCTTRTRERLFSLHAKILKRVDSSRKSVLSVFLDNLLLWYAVDV